MFPWFQLPQIPQPIIKFPEFYGGQMGVPGSDSPMGILQSGAGTCLYVNSAHPEASNNNDGTNPKYPKATLQSAVNSTLLTNYSRIFVEGTVSESVVTGDYDDMPSYVWIIGVGDSRYSLAWDSGAAASPCLDLRCVGWRVSKFRFYGPTTAACVVLRHTDVTGNDIAIRTILDGNYFDGLTVGRYGIDSHGCYDCWFVGNTFSLFHNAVAGGAIPMVVTVSPLAIPYRNHVVGNLFYDCDNGAIFPSNGSFFYQNMFQPVGYAYSMTQVLNTSTIGNPGDDNVVWGNTFPGDYSIVGGYRPGAADSWLGNWADDVAEAEVGDNGITIARPT